MMSNQARKKKALRKIHRRIPKLFEKEIRAMIYKELPTAFIYKPPDGPFGARRPFDYLILDDGFFGGVECKSKTSEDVDSAEWDPKEVKPHQLDCLKKVKSCGGFAYVVLGWYQLDFPNYKLKKIFTFTPEEIEKLLASDKNVHYK